MKTSLSRITEIETLEFLLYYGNTSWKVFYSARQTWDQDHLNKFTKAQTGLED